MIRTTNAVLRQRLRSIFDISFVVELCIVLVKLNLVIATDGIDFNINDIFNTNMMPFQIFSQQFDTKLGQKNTRDFFPILRTMNYHRKMMQQFMASDYLTAQILYWKTARTESTIRRRTGKFQNQSIYNKDFNLIRASMEPFKKLLFDDGSTRYNAWLKRITTLDDIQHQINTAANHLKAYKDPIRRQIMTPATHISYLGDEDTDSGDITGYAYEGSHNDSKYINVSPFKVIQMPRLSIKNPRLGINLKQISKNGYETALDGFGIHQSPPELLHSISQQAKPIREISFKDVTDIALTTLAFLSFGMFILQVLMCITMSKEESNNLMMLPMEATDIGDTNDGTEEIRRKKRSINNNKDILKEVNQLTEIFLMTMDSLHLKDNNKINIKYNYKPFCGDSPFNTETKLTQNIWTTLYSLGTSWLAARTSGNYFLIIKRIAHIFEHCT